MTSNRSIAVIEKIIYNEIERYFESTNNTFRKKSLKEGALDSQIAAAELKVDQAKKTLAAAVTALAKLKEQEAKASSAA